MRDEEITPEMIYNAIQANREQGLAWFESLGRRGIHAALLYPEYARKREGDFSTYEQRQAAAGDW